MKKHWKKILLSIFGLYLVYGIITLVPAYMENKEWERREENAIEIMNVMNDPYLSYEEREAKLQELSGISADGVGSNGIMHYEVYDKSTTKEYRELKEALKENGFTITDSNNSGLVAIYEDNKDEIRVQYINYGDAKEVEISFVYDDITKIKVSKHKKIKDILKVLEIEKLNVDNKIKTLKTSDDEIKLSLDNDWDLTIMKIDDNDMDSINGTWGNFGNSNSNNNSSKAENMLFLTFEKTLY